MIGPCFDGIVFAALLWPVGVIQVISQSQMLTTKIDCKFSELQDAVLPLLRGRVFHLADVAALDSFYRRGWIPAG
jgi:hypothetical protein